MNKNLAVEQELDQLPRLERSSLQSKFFRLYETEPPKNISRSLLELAIAYKIQERAFGGLKPNMRRALIAGDLLAPNRIASGSIFVREWHGVHHTVRVTDDGVLYRDRTYGSLSEVARLITGGHCSGPAFFGVKRKAKVKA